MRPGRAALHPAGQQRPSVFRQRKDGRRIGMRAGWMDPWPETPLSRHNSGDRRRWTFNYRFVIFWKDAGEGGRDTIRDSGTGSIGRCAPIEAWGILSAAAPWRLRRRDYHCRLTPRLPFKGRGKKRARTIPWEATRGSHRSKNMVRAQAGKSARVPAREGPSLF
jgi:hypothetical protein